MEYSKMKKKIFLITLLLIIVALAVAVTSYIGKRTEMPGVESSQPSASEELKDNRRDLLNFLTLDVFVQYCEENEIKYAATTNGLVATIYDLDGYLDGAFLTYFFDDSGNSVEVEMSCYLNAELDETGGSMTVESLTFDEAVASIEKALLSFRMLFDCGYDVDYYLANEDGSFKKVESPNDYQALLDGKAHLQLTIRDQEGYYWRRIITSYGEVISANINKYFDKEEYKDYFANISLYKEEE